MNIKVFFSFLIVERDLEEEQYKKVKRVVSYGSSQHSISFPKALLILVSTRSAGLTAARFTC